MSKISTNIEVTPTRFQHIHDGRTTEYFFREKGCCRLQSHSSSLIQGNRVLLTLSNGQVCRAEDEAHKRDANMVQSRAA